MYVTSTNEDVAIHSFPISNKHHFPPALVDHKLYYFSREDCLSYFSLEDHKSTCILENIFAITTIDYIDELNALFIIFNHGNSIMLYDLSSNQVTFESNRNKEKCLLPAKNVYSYFIDSNKLFITDWNCSEISVFDLSNNEVIWSNNETKGSSLVVNLGKHILVATNQYYRSGSIEIFNKKNGEKIYNTALFVETKMDPIVTENSVIIYCFDNQVISFDKNSFNIEQLIKFNNPDERWGMNQMKLLNNKIVVQNLSFERIAFDLETRKTSLIEKADRGGYVDIILDSLGHYRFIEY